MRIVPVLAVACLLAGCGDPDPPAGPLPASSPPPAAVPSPVPRTFGTVLIDPTSVPAPATPRPATTRATRPAGTTSGGWEITVYYTAVERFHDGEREQVTGCPRLACRDGDTDLGTYPASFVQAVQDEGTGLTASGRYLNWSYDVGYWLDTAARDSFGGRLEPFVTAAADPDVLRRGTGFTITGCGRQDDGSAPPAQVCAALRDADWTIRDEFTPGLGGDRHLDAYIGPETGPGFTDSPWYTTVTGATLAIG